MTLQHLLISLSLLALLGSSACKSKEASTAAETETAVEAATPPRSATVETPPEPPTPPSPEPQPVEETTAKEEALLARLSRGSCYGRCPVYEIELYDTGLALYKGKRFVEKIGEYQAMVGKERIDLLRQKAQEVGYFDFAGKYPREGQGIVDLPTCQTYLKDRDGSEHEIFNRNNAPADLIEYEQYFDSLFAQTVWLKRN